MSNCQGPNEARLRQRGNDSQVPRGRGRPGTAAARREPGARPAPTPFKLRRRLPGASRWVLRILRLRGWISFLFPVLALRGLKSGDLLCKWGAGILFNVLCLLSSFRLP